MAPTSHTFPKHYLDRPPRYSTPPPPSRDHVERPVSPSYPQTTIQVYPGHQLGSANGLYSHSPQGLGVSFGGSSSQANNWNNATPYAFGVPPSSYNTSRQNSLNGTSSGGYANKGRGHNRSGSNIEILANVALSPDVYESPQLKHEWPTPQPPLYGEPLMSERPSKRARSEKLPSPNVGRTGSRPATSYTSNQMADLEDAQLLLNLMNPAKFSASETSPPSHPPQSTTNHMHVSIVSPVVSPKQPHKPSIAETENLPEPSIAPGPVPDQAATDANPPPTVEAAEPQNQLYETGSLVPQNQDQNEPLNAGDQTAQENKDGEGENEQLVVAEEPSIIPPAASTDNAPPMDSGSENSANRPTKRKASAQVTQALCAGCNQVQITVAGEDQDVNSWIGCDACKRWFHYACAGFITQQEVRAVDNFFCKDCQPKHGPTTYVRKSSRARTAIDYAGLNQGMVQSSADTPDHNYIAPIKEGKIQFQPDNFPRMRPENVTADYFLKSPHGMATPVVIPADWNPRPGTAARGVLDEDEELVQFMANEPDELDVNAELAMIPDEGQDALDMVMPNDLTVRKVAELYGPEEKLDVIDVKSQQSDKRWTLSKWADYYESTGEKPVRNVISLEISQSRLGKLIRRPKIVRDLDLQDAVWPPEKQAIGDHPKVQFYCLMSVADCYTDFHIDFGGSSVYYHILKGKKTFFFIPPKEAYLKKYADWCNSPSQDTTFLGNETGECMRVDLSEGDTMLIPAGWIHAVWTPADSLVIGGNFLTRMNFEMQIKVNQIEKDTKINLKFRYPFFQKINWYAAIQYLHEDPIPQDLVDRFFEDETFEFPREQNVYDEVNGRNDAAAGSHLYNARYYSQKEVHGWPALRDFLYRTARIAAGLLTDGLTADTKRSVTRSVPKNYGDPMHLIKMFAMWIAWKKGNVRPPEWVRIDVKPVIKEKPKKSEPTRLPGERHSSRVQLQQQEAKIKASTSDGDVEDENKAKTTTPKPSGLGPRRVACDACRKRRIRCRHKDEEDVPSKSPETTKVEIGDASIRVAQPPITLVGFDGTSSPPTKENPASSKELTHPPLAGTDPVTIAPATPGGQLSAASSTNSSTGKKGRPKACDDCRKSKRRCVHDEHGHLDPVKAAEPAKPRGSTTNKRPPRTSGENMSPPPKKIKRSSDATRRPSSHEINLVESARSALAEAPLDPNLAAEQDAAFEALLDPALREYDSAPQANSPENPESSILPGYTPATTLPSHASPSSYPLLLNGVTESSEHEGDNSSKSQPGTAILDANLHIDGSIPDPGTKWDNQAEMQIDPMLQEFPSTELNPSELLRPTSPREQKMPANDSPSVTASASAHQEAPNLTLRTEMSSNSMVSPPNSLPNNSPDPTVGQNSEITKSIEVAHEAGSEQVHSLHTPSSTSRHSSRQPRRVVSAGQDETLKPVTSAPVAEVDKETKKSVSPMNGIRNARPGSSHSAGNAAGSGKSPRSASFGSMDGIDPENMKLIRELQEQDFGLRRRARV
ncbi:MAG: hypothetical protein Q9227_003132 [Pyrenula ochraceoflavens]